MYTVLLVDDETSMLDTLIQGIHWQQYGVDSVLTAQDGLQALDILSGKHVDLLITDIKMPHMDGLSLLKAVRSTYPDTHCLILTAYEEFDYARQAMQLGVENYLLKPLELEEMEESIERALDNIYANRRISHRLFRNNVFTRWVNRTISTVELAERANLLKLNLYLPEYCVVVFRKKQHALSLSSYCQSCLEQLSVYYDVHHFKDDSDRHVLILGGGQLNTQQITNILSAEAHRRNLGHLLMAAVGNTVAGPDNVPESYQAASDLIESADPDTYLPTTVLDLTILRSSPNSEQDKTSLTQQLSLLFQIGDEEEQNTERFASFSEQLVEMTNQRSLASVQTLLSHSLIRLFAQDFPNHPDAQSQLNNRLRMTRSIADVDAFTADVTDLLAFSSLLYRYYVNKLHPLVQSAIHYIHAHYCEAISIPEFCIQTKVSSPYLGYLFKKETGYFFNSYLTQHRIYCSIPLLLDSDLKINDIAAQVGFTSASYYITRFKQQIGMSPIKYRSKAR